MVTNIADDFSKPWKIVGQFTGFYVLAEKIAKYSSEIFVPWKRHETS
jgi:hypothetical protein